MASSALRTSLVIMSRPYRLRVPSHTRIASVKASARPHTKPLTPYTHRQFSQSTLLEYPRKDSQDKDSINTEASEYSKSATDDEAARQEDAAFDPDITDPQEAKDVAGKNRGVSIF